MSARRCAFPVVVSRRRAGATLLLRLEPPPAGSQRLTRIDRVVEAELAGIDRVVVDAGNFVRFTAGNTAPLRCLRDCLAAEGIFDLALVNAPEDAERQLAALDLALAVVRSDHLQVA